MRTYKSLTDQEKEFLNLYRALNDYGQELAASMIGGLTLNEKYQNPVLAAHKALEADFHKR